MRKKVEQTISTKVSKAVLLINLLFLTIGIKGQSPVYSFSQSSGTYSAITGGTVYSSGGSMDDAVFAFTLPFTYTFNTLPYTSGFVSENGYISFGATTPNAGTRRVISNVQTGFQAAAPFAHDLGGETASEMRGEILGSAPNRTFVVQWSNMVEYLASSASFNFQVRINEGGGVEANQKVEFVYGNCTNSWADLNPQVGLRGLNNTQFINRTSSGTSWLTNTAGTGNNDGCLFSASNASIAPVSGLTFIWSRMYPVVTYTGSLSSFITCSGTASPSQTLAVSGSSLAANILITAPSGMEVSSTSPTAGYSNTVTLARSNFTVAPTTLYLRITSAASGTISGNVTISSFGATTQSIAVTGTVNNCSPAAALNFDGTDDRVNLGNGITTSLSGATKVSVEAWVKPTSLSGLGCIVGNYSTGSANLQILLRRNTNSYYEFWVGNGSSWYQTTSAATPTVNVWQHVAATWNGTVASIYVNGVLSGTTTPAISAMGNAGSNPVWLGGNAINENFTGNIDEVRVWNVARTQCEINTYKNCEIPTTATGLLANYHFNQGFDGLSNASVTTLTDVSASAYTGTLTNMALTGTVSNWVAPGGVTSGSVTPANLAITVGSTVTNSVVCSGNSTTLNGTGANTYVWTGGVSNAVVFTPTVTNTYTVTGTNTLTGCTNTAVSSVTVNALPSVTSSVTNVSCNGGNNGSATVTATGGTSPYTYLASNGATVSAQSGLMPGTYTYSVTDNNGCTKTQGLTITQPSAIVTVSAVTNVLCNGGTNGSATVTATGGTSPYSYLASNGATVSPQSGLMAGTYVYTVTDNNGCTKTQGLTITQPSAIVTASAVTNILCNGGTNGSATVTATGGTSPYSYLASNGATVSAQSGLMPGSYTYTVTDANACEQTQSLSITEPTAINLSTSASNGTICSGASSTLTANATGGTGTITYTWVSGSTTNVNTVTPTTTAVYTVDVTDANNCVSTSTIAITVNALPTLVAVTNNTLLCTGETATLTVSGTATTYTWSTTDNTTTVAVSPTVQTTYTVDGTDGNGCKNTTTVTQDVSLCTGIATLSNDAKTKLYPNPNNGLFVIELTTLSKVTVTNALGQVVISETFEAGKHSLDINNETTGVYFVKVMENNNQQIIKVIKQ
jgi:hypothetical protein